MHRFIALNHTQTDGKQLVEAKPSGKCKYFTGTSDACRSSSFLVLAVFTFVVLVMQPPLKA